MHTLVVVSYLFWYHLNYNFLSFSNVSQNLEILFTLLQNVGTQKTPPLEMSKPNPFEEQWKMQNSKRKKQLEIQIKNSLGYEPIFYISR